MRKIAKKKAVIFLPNGIILIKITIMKAMDGTSKRMNRLGIDRGWKFADKSENASGNQAIPTKIAALGLTRSADTKT